MIALKASDGGLSVSIEIAACGDANLVLHLFDKITLSSLVLVSFAPRRPLAEYGRQGCGPGHYRGRL